MINYYVWLKDASWLEITATLSPTYKCKSDVIVIWVATLSDSSILEIPVIIIGFGVTAIVIRTLANRIARRDGDPTANEIS